VGGIVGSPGGLGTGGFEELALSEIHQLSSNLRLSV
jgi:hypothetical protein